MIGGIAMVGGLLAATCAWMAYGDDDPNWVRGAARNIVYVVGGFAVLLAAVWALDGWGFI